MGEVQGGDLMELLVRELRWEAHDVISVVLEDADGAMLPPWRPGSHVDIHLPNGLVRQYSISGDPQSLGHYRLGVLIEREGRGGSRFIGEQLRPGDTVLVSRPGNHFELVDASSYCFIAGGIGITPILPMLREVASRGRCWRLYYGGQSHTSMAFLEELSTFGGRAELFSRAEVGDLPLTRIIQAMEPGCAVYCCGPEGLIQAVEELVDAAPTLTSHVERFQARPRVATSPDRATRVFLQQSGLMLAVPPGKSVLDAVLEAGVDVASTCLEGYCGSCETKDVCGQVDHRDSILTERERSANSSMFLCVSRPLSDDVVLDL